MLHLAQALLRSWRKTAPSFSNLPVDLRVFPTRRAPWHRLRCVSFPVPPSKTLCFNCSLPWFRILRRPLWRRQVPSRLTRHHLACPTYFHAPRYNPVWHLWFLKHRRSVYFLPRHQRRRFCYTWGRSHEDLRQKKNFCCLIDCRDQCLTWTCDRQF